MSRDMWWFQKSATQKVVDRFCNTRKVVLVSPPGSGKTVMGGQIVKEVGPKRVVCLTHTLGLVRNFKERLGIDTYTLQECLARGGIAGATPPDMVIWDECHHSAGAAWGTVLDMVPKKALVLGLTGTPQRSDGKPLDRFDEMEVAAHYSELLMAGTIVPYRCLYPKEFRTDAIPDPALAYRRYGEGRKAIFYSRSIEQANEVAKALGKKARVWHSELPWKGKDGREANLKRFEQNEISCLVTVDALAEGVDIPDSEVIVLSSTCHNVGTYLQKTGRGGRSAPGKTHALLIDLSGAHLRHGPPTEDREYSITGTGIERKTGFGGSGNGDDWYYERGPRDPSDLGSFDAELIVGYDWRAPTAEDKRKSLGWLVECAGRRGWTKEVAESVFQTLFGEAPQ
jgi:superfamily II DNA or RNA helicase